MKLPRATRTVPVLSLPAAVALLVVGISGCDGRVDGGARAQTPAPETVVPDRSRPDVSAALEARRVWAWEMPAGSEAMDLYAGDISPDGRYLTEINWATGDLAMIDLETGETRDVTGKGYNYGGSDGRWAWFSKFSPDGRRLAVNFFLTEKESLELRVMNRDGSESRVVVPARPDPTGVQPQDWSPDGDHLLASVERADGTWQIGLVSLADGSLEVLKSLGWRYRYTTELTFSPDGEWIAYEYPSEESEDAGDIYLLTTDGSRETKLVGDPSDDELMGWTPDGKAILFYSDRSGTPGIWTVPVEDGRRVGQPELQRADVWGLEPVGSTREGFAYAVHVERPRVHTAVLDLEAGEVVASPRPLDDRPSRRSSSPAWSADGNRLAYVFHASGGAPGTAVVIQSADGEVARTLPLRNITALPRARLQWVADDALLFLARDSKERTGLYRMNLNDGSVTLLYREEENERGHVPGPEGRTLYFGRTATGDAGRPHHETRDLLIASDLTTGEETVLDSAHIGKRASVSPDGDRLVYSVHDDLEGIFELRVVPTAGGEPRMVHRRSSEELTPGVAWGPDGEQILFTAPDPSMERTSPYANQGTVLYAVPVAGGEARKVLELDPSGGIAFPFALTAHPAGARIAFVGGKKRGELWMLGGLSAGGAAPSGGEPVRPRSTTPAPN